MSIIEYESESNFPDGNGLMNGFNYCSNSCRTANTTTYQCGEDGRYSTVCKNCREGVKEVEERKEEEEEEEIITLKCNRCTGRKLVEEGFPLKKVGVGRTKSCKFCVEYQVKYGKEKYETEKGEREKVKQDEKEKKEQDDIDNGVVKVVKAPAVVKEPFKALEYYMTCECGLTITTKNRHRHMESKKHLNLMKMIN
jgi:hypothetical protein